MSRLMQLIHGRKPWGLIATVLVVVVFVVAGFVKILVSRGMFASVTGTSPTSTTSTTSTTSESDAATSTVTTSSDGFFPTQLEGNGHPIGGETSTVGNDDVPSVPIPDGMFGKQQLLDQLGLFLPAYYQTTWNETELSWRDRVGPYVTPAVLESLNFRVQDFYFPADVQKERHDKQENVVGVFDLTRLNHTVENEVNLELYILVPFHWRVTTAGKDPVDLPGTLLAATNWKLTDGLWQLTAVARSNE